MALVSRRGIPPLRIWINDVVALQQGVQVAFTRDRAYNMLINADAYDEDTFTPEYITLTSQNTIPDLVFSMQLFLNVLNADRIGLKVIPSGIHVLRQLTELSFRNNKLQCIPRELCTLSNLTSLFLSNNQLSSLPELGDLHALSVLDVSGNTLEALPDSICQLTKLHTLHAHNNELTRIPESIGNMRDLKTLSLSSNLLRQLPESVLCLHKLTSLDLSDNLLTSLPEGFLSHLSNLGALYVHENELTSFTFAYHSKLKCLNISRNAIVELGEYVGWMTALKIIDVSENRIQDVSECILQLEKLTSIYIHDNILSSKALHTLFVLESEYGTNVVLY